MSQVRDAASLQEALRARGLEAVLEPARSAGGHALQRLEAELLRLDWDALDRQRDALKATAEAPAGKIGPPELAPPSSRDCPENRAAAERGWDALRSGRVALATVAGGQASRLGFQGPKGAFPLGPVTGATLFQILAGQVARLRERAGRTLPWVIQTGPENHSETQRFFERRSYFGLGSASVHFVCQGTLPALSPDGQLLLAHPERLFQSPDGHGGFYRALETSGAFESLAAQGVDLLFYCQIDNPLVRMGDPVFLGHHLERGAQMSVKVVEKTDPGEKVGLVVRRDNHTGCLEYSDLPEGFAEQRADDGGLRFRAGNIAIHAFDLDFAREMATRADALPLHLARKDVQALDGGLEARLRPGVKFETFVFDALSAADEVCVQLCERGEEFAPVKNRSGNDSAATSRTALETRNRAWCMQAGLEPAAHGAIEFAPALATDARDLAEQASQLKFELGGRLLRRPAQRG